MGNIMLSDGGKATKNLRNDQGNSPYTLLLQQEMIREN